MRLVEFELLNGYMISYNPTHIGVRQLDDSVGIFTDREEWFVKGTYRKAVDKINAALNYDSDAVDPPGERVVCPSCKRAVTSLTSQGFCGHCSTMEG